MVEYDSGPNEELINLELKLIKILNKYLREIKFNDLEKNKSILKAFSECFIKINHRYKKPNKQGKGIYMMPIHRSFSFFFARLLFFNFMDKK